MKSDEAHFQIVRALANALNEALLDAQHDGLEAAISVRDVMPEDARNGVRAGKRVEFGLTRSIRYF